MTAAHFQFRTKGPNHYMAMHVAHTDPYDCKYHSHVMVWPLRAKLWVGKGWGKCGSMPSLLRELWS
jgi:hypothetical protein